jgi:nitrate reductase alpha subunit
MTASVTNPFILAMPLTGIPRIWDTRSDSEHLVGVSGKLADLTEDDRFNDYWKFIEDGKAKPYLQRIIDHSNTVKGYEIEELLSKARDGVPAIIMSRTYPKYIGLDQSEESAPWYNKTGRLEFYREEPEFQDYGENLPLHREAIDATFYEPNVIIAKDHPMINPKTPSDYGWPTDDLSGETRQVRNVVYTPDEVLNTEHPLIKEGFTHIYLTPKYRHSVHTFNVDNELVSIWFGPFGDRYRMDKRKPWVGEGYVEINPDDARELGIEDGDYIWVDADPEDRPFHGWQEKPDDYKVARCMLRAKYCPNLPKGVSKTWFNMYMATHGSVKGHETNEDGLARNPETNYQAMFRYGGHQSATRSWLRPTLLTDTLVRKNLMGQMIGKGFVPDVHCANGAPRESFVKFTKAEDGGETGSGKWRPAELGFRRGYENETMKKFIQGGYISNGGE